MGEQDIQQLTVDTNTNNISILLNNTIIAVDTLYKKYSDPNYNINGRFDDVLENLNIIKSNVNSEDSDINYLINMNINYRLLIPELIGNTPINPNLWELYTTPVNFDDQDILYNQYKEYKIGDIVKFNGSYYKCIGQDQDKGLFHFYDVLESFIEKPFFTIQVDKSIPINKVFETILTLLDGINDADCILISTLMDRYKYLLNKNDDSNLFPRCYDFITKQLNQEMNYYRYSELAEKDSNFNIADHFREFAINEKWKNKSELWEILAAACNDVGAEFYSKIKNYVKQISDIDMCNVKALSSMAKSVNYSSTTLDIYNSTLFPIELSRLIDIFSIDKNILFNQQNGILSESSVSDLIGFIDTDRNDSNIPMTFNEETKQLDSRIQYNIIVLIKENIKQIEYVMSHNDIEFKSNDNNISDEITLQSAIDTIKQIEFSKLSSYQKITDDNPFFIITQILQKYIFTYNIESDAWTLIDMTYVDEKTNIQSDMVEVFTKIIQTVKQYDTTYKYQFVLFHIFGLFYSKIFDFELDQSYKYPTQKVSEYTLDEFKQSCEQYIGSTDIMEYLKVNSIYNVGGDQIIKNLTQNNVDFVKYYTILTKMFSEEDESISFNFKHVYLLNKSERIRLLLRMINLSKYLTDFCIKLSYERHLIKNQIKICAQSGTKQIIENVLKNYFISNFSRQDSNLYNDGLSQYYSTVDDLTDAKQPFEIEFVEYVDTTNYFNITAELPKEVVGTRPTGKYETYVHEYIDEHGKLQSEQKTRPIYEDVLADPVISDSSERYWESISNNLSNGDIESYKDFYTQWMGPNFTTDDYLTDLVPFLNELYEISNPSSTNDEEMDKLLMFDSTNYVNSNIRNHKNKNFPSIAPITFLPNLIPVKELFSEDVLQLSKPFYDATIQYVNTILIDLIHDFDYNRDKQYQIIKDGWKTSYAEYNGYTSEYEDKTNGNVFGLYGDKRIDNDGPWVYSSLQEFLYIYYNKLLVSTNKKPQTPRDSSTGIIPTDTTGNTVNYITKHNTWIDKFIKNQYVYDQSSMTDNIIQKLREKFKSYLFDYSSFINGINSTDDYDNQIYKLFSNIDYINAGVTSIDTNGNYFIKPLYKLGCKLNDIQNYIIFNFDNDVYDNQYTLYKHKDHANFEDVGQVWIRLYNHPLSLPLLAHLDGFSSKNDNSNYSIIKDLSENCITFKCYDNTMWLFGYTTYNSTKQLRLAVFNFTYDEEDLTVYIDENSIHYLSSDNISPYLENINSFVGEYLNTNGNIDFLTYSYSVFNKYAVSSDQYLITVNKHSYNILKGFVESQVLVAEPTNGIIVSEQPVLKEYLNNLQQKPFLYNNYVQQFDLIKSNPEKCTSKSLSYIWNVNYNKNDNLLYIGFDFMNKNFDLTSSEIIDEGELTGWTRSIYLCPLIKYLTSFENEIIYDGLESNIATNLQVTFDYQLFEVYTQKDDQGNVTILEKSLNEIKNSFIIASRNSVQKLDTILVPIWTFIGDQGDISKYLTDISYDGDVTEKQQFVDFITSGLTDIVADYSATINEIGIQFSDFILNTYNKTVTADNLNIYYTIEIDTNNYNICVDLFNDCIVCMNQTGIIKFSFDDVINEHLDMDISVRIDDNGVYSDPVGWNCMSMQTSYLNWVTMDNTTGGPEVVTFNILKYAESKNDGDVNIKLLTCAHWFSTLQNNNFSRIELFYKGFYDKVDLCVLPHDTGCSSNQIALINILFNKQQNRLSLKSVQLQNSLLHYGVEIVWNDKPGHIGIDQYSSFVDNMRIFYSTLDTFKHNVSLSGKNYYYVGSIDQSIFNMSPDNTNYWIKLNENVDNYTIFRQNVNYKINDIVQYNNTLYKCIKDVNYDLTIRQQILNNILSNVDINIIDKINKNVSNKPSGDLNLLNNAIYLNSGVEYKKGIVPLFDVVGINDHKEFNDIYLKQYCNIDRIIKN